MMFSAALGAASTEDAWDRQLVKGAELADAGRYAEAREALEKGRDQAERMEPDGTRLALALNNLGAVNFRLNDVHQAELCYRRSADIWEAHGEVANRLAPVTNLAAVYLARRQFTQVDRLLRHQMELVAEKLGPDHKHMAVILTYLADSALQQQAFTAAADYDERALEVVRKVHPQVHPDVAMALNNLGAIYRAQHRLEESSRLYAEALEIMQASGQPDHPAWIRALSDYGAVRFRQGRYQEAKRFLAEALKRAETALGPDHPTVASILRDYALVLRKNKNKLEAKKAEARVARIMGQSGRDNQLGYTVDVRTLLLRPSQLVAR
jgi:tetratricopeptide (TPR) repeat protein